MSKFHVNYRDLPSPVWGLGFRTKKEAKEFEDSADHNSLFLGLLQRILEELEKINNRYIK